jgi:excisionase family DNA binding protein
MIKNPVTLQEAAAIAKMTYRCFYHWVKQGRTPAYEKFGKIYLFDADEMLAWKPKQEKRGAKPCLKSK